MTIEQRLDQIEAQQRRIIAMLEARLDSSDEPKGMDAVTREAIFSLPDPVAALRERGRKQRQMMRAK
ncbi:hypothetical protein MJO47_09190 [Desulfuromonas sp. KJ2020]|uniref:hypothetical protein n=1 Tax=Desulfuromonas sp. KJ2020 TaxID=2919173 RepID=UPI0020A70F2C|nr:hypothetical protein [Desulfuromonas sp. KJ2020]MCP3177271.1 hypothetical protein [Desulfuromonas sp. KJ2020]